MIRLLVFILFFLLSASFTYCQSSIGDTTSINELYEPIDGENEDTYNDEAYDDIDESSENSNFRLRKISHSSWEKILKDKEFVYSHAKKKIKKEKKPSPFWELLGAFLSSSFFKFLLYAIAIFVLLFVLFKLFSQTNFSYFFRKKKKESTAYETDYEEVLSIDWDKKIESAIAEKNYKLATRYLYNSTLQKLNEQNIITYHSEKTNWEYCMQLSGTSFEMPFKELTQYFDYVWYGQFHIAVSQFQQIHQKFNTFHSSLYA
ncbi:MAG: hypothetical protein R2831_09915 [Chitinophagaceae bacterium]